MKHLKSFNESFINENKSIIEDIINYINPCDPMMSDDYGYYCWGDDEAYYADDLKSDDYLDIIKSCVFREDSTTAKKFGYDILIKYKEEILKQCDEELKRHLQLIQ